MCKAGTEDVPTVNPPKKRAAAVYVLAVLWRFSGLAPCILEEYTMAMMIPVGNRSHLISDIGRQDRPGKAASDGLTIDCDDFAEDDAVLTNAIAQ